MDPNILFEYLNIVLKEIIKPNISIDDSLEGSKAYIKDRIITSPYLYVLIKTNIEGNENKKIILINDHCNSNLEGLNIDNNNTSCNLILSPEIARMFLYETPQIIYVRGLNCISFLPHADACLLDLPLSFYIDSYNEEKRIRIKNDIKVILEQILKDNIISRGAQFKIKINQLIPITITIINIESDEIENIQYRSTSSTRITIN